MTSAVIPNELLNESISAKKTHFDRLLAIFFRGTNVAPKIDGIKSAQSCNTAAVDYQLKTSLVMAACHDMRQPLQALGLLSESLKLANLEPHHQKTALQMNQAVGTLYGMLDQMLMMMQLDAPAYQPAITDFSIGEILGQIKNDLDPLAKEKGLELTVECCSAFVRSDRVLLYRALSNLICNAISYTQHGKIAVRCIESQATLRIEVSDTGIGIAEKNLPHIFDDFYRVNRSQSKCHLGLGLANVRRISNMMLWRLCVHSEIGKGSTFSMAIDWSRK